jgi:hypothetical protein
MCVTVGAVGQSSFPELMRFRDENEFGVRLYFHLNQPLLSTIAHLVEADMLVSAKVRGAYTHTHIHTRAQLPRPSE